MAFRVLKLIKCSNTLKNTTIYIIFYKISIELRHHFYKNLQKILPSSSEKVARSLAKNQDKKLKLIYLKEHEKEIKKRANYDLADFLNLSKDIPYHITPEKYKPNDFYYNALTLKKYAGINESSFISATMEHGSYLADDYYWDSDINFPFNTIIVNSNLRKNVLSKACNKNIEVVGPYIAYAQSLLTASQVQKEKKRLGKNLLVFPMHSTHWIDVNYNIQEFIKQINHIAKEFNSVRICMYWKDILRGDYKPYKEEGFEIVCAGHIYEPHFLPRLRSLIEISDHTMSSQAGTQLCYSIYLDRPHLLYQNDSELVVHLDEIKNDTDNRAKKVADGNNFKEIHAVFSEFSSGITKEQYNVVDKYWGISSVKSKEELRDLLLNVRKIGKLTT